LSTRPVRQELAEIPTDPAGHERRRRQVVAGAYTLRPCAHPVVTIVAVGGIVTEAIEARDRLTEMGINVEVVCVTSPSLLFEAVRSRQGLCDAPTWILDQVFPADRAAPMVTVIDGHPHTLAFLLAINLVRGTQLGVDKFRQAGSLDAVYRYHGIDADSIVRAGLDLAD
jgi:pyruvate dehydrogenase E1 component